jgi:hypothetical protein
MADENKNLTLWNKLKQPPKEVLKKITGGRLKNFTDINPQWRLKVMTEQFGKIGQGWKYDIVERWSEIFEEQVACFVRINLFYKTNPDDITPVWSEPIEGIGGSMLAAKEKAGIYVSAEGYKMALTDALGVAMKQLGVAADIYMGFYDGSKYQESPDLKDASQITDKEMEVINMVFEKLIDFAAEKDLTVDIDKLKGFLYSLKGKYPDDKSKVGVIAGYIVNQGIEKICN